MSPDALVEVSLSRISDFVERCQHLLSEGNRKDANLLRSETLMITQALDNNDTFLVFHPPDQTDEGVYSIGLRAR